MAAVSGLFLHLFLEKLVVTLRSLTVNGIPEFYVELALLPFYLRLFAASDILVKATRLPLQLMDADSEVSFRTDADVLWQMFTEVIMELRALPPEETAALVIRANLYIMFPFDFLEAMCLFF